jgi:Mn2+/Fe2+ NRAMP family transporter
VLIASSGYKAISVIWFAQVANGLLLPIMVVFLIWMLNKPALKKHRNNFKQNILASVVLLVTILLSARSLLSAFNVL